MDEPVDKMDVAAWGCDARTKLAISLLEKILDQSWNAKTNEPLVKNVIGLLKLNQGDYQNF